MKTSMKNLFILVFFLIMANTASAQNLTSEQREVWAIVQKYWEAWVSGDVQSFLEIYEDSYASSLNTSDFPQTKASTIKRLEQDIKNFKAIFFTISPLKIWVKGKFALVNYSYSQTHRNIATYLDETKAGKLTNTLVKKEGKWLLVGDHSRISKTQ